MSILLIITRIIKYRHDPLTSSVFQGLSVDLTLMQTERKEYMLVIAKNNRIILFLVLIPLMLFAFQFFPGVVTADDHKKRESGDKRYESREEHYDSRDRTGRQLEKKMMEMRSRVKQPLGFLWLPILPLFSAYSLKA